MVRESTSPTSPAPTSGNAFRLAVLGLIGLGAGSSAFFFGFYRATVWEPMLLAGLVILLAFVVARPAIPQGASALGAAGLFALGFWALASTRWAELGDLAVTDGARWLLYGVLLMVLLYLVRDSSSRKVLIGATTTGVLVMAAYLQIRLLVDDSAVQELFVANRLNSPLDYINGVATYLLAGLWPLVAVAERARNHAVRGLAAFGAVQLVVLTVLTQSRGAILALVASTVLIMAIVPGRTGRAWILVAVLGGIAICGPALREVIDTGAGALSIDSLRPVVWMGLLGGIVSGLLVAAGSAISARIERGSPDARYGLSVISGVGLAVICVIVLGGMVLGVGSRSDQIREQVDSFTSLDETDGDSRLTSGGGNRYDYWRVAFKQFEDNPLAGVGAGNYTETYFQERRTSEDVQQAHSIELQTLGELGLVGGVALTAFVCAVLFGLWNTARGTTTRRSAEPALAVAAGGTFFVWLFHTSVDWMHLLPGLTAIAICAAAVLLPAMRPLESRYSVPAIGMAALLVVVISFPVLKQLRAQQLQSQAAEKLATDPVSALVDARDSIALEPSQRSYYMESAALARLGLYGPARDALLEATRNGPHDFVAWGLLGDLATRRGLTQEAQRYYRRALHLNPRDPGLARLVAEGEVNP
ncbi:MAG: O-antigen ligase family protein [Solirubrobacterales bacterium]|nr:O-antigen ligase family protein [Solirubrobacterales bacterium]